jgi:serine/threonine protein kinase
MQVNYLHSHGLAHTELRIENVHVSPIDKHVKVSSLFFVCVKLLFSILTIMRW